jgi:hypothetical protein
MLASVTEPKDFGLVDAPTTATLRGANRRDCWAAV